MAKKKKKRAKPKKTPLTLCPYAHVERDLDEIDRLLRRREWGEAIPRQEARHARYPSNIIVLNELVDAFHDTEKTECPWRYA